MKLIFYLVVSISLLFSCGNPESKENNEPNTKEKQVSTANQENSENSRVSGFFNVSIGNESYKSSQLQDNYCNMTFNYNGEKSFVGIRFKDINTKDAMLVNIYGDENYISNPIGMIESFMFSGPAAKKVNIQFIPGNGKGIMESTAMVEGNFNIDKFSEGLIEGTFEGKGALPKDVITKNNLTPFKGELKLKTKIITTIGK